jgi:galactokinase
VNLIGEHTDYNGGFVLPTSIPQRTRVELTLRNDRTVLVRSSNKNDVGEFVFGEEQRRGDWVDYVQGVTWALRQAGHVLKEGFELSISSDVPLGAGLSSSAALEVAVLRALRGAFELDLTDVQLAQLGQIAENEFVGARCGIMDQMAASLSSSLGSSLADGQTALFLDTRSLEFRRIPLPAEADLVVVHSGVSHGIASLGQGEQSAYNTRRAECEEAARRLDVPQLRDLTLDDLPRISRLPEPLGGRARHVVTEDKRVLEAVKALEACDLEQLGQLFAASHASMRDDFEVSVPEVDLLVELAQADEAMYGARMTGGGFGGSVVMLARQGQGRAAGERIARTYAEHSGRTPTLLVPSPALS